MWGTTIHVAYLPEISQELKDFIFKNVTPTLGCGNDSTRQYFAESVLTLAEELLFTISNEDMVIFKAMEHEGIEYLEF